MCMCSVCRKLVVVVVMVLVVVVVVYMCSVFSV